MKTLVDRAPRVEFDNPLPSSIDDQVMGRIQNISLTGCKLNARSWMKINGALHRIHVSTEQGELQLSGQIVRARMIPTDAGSIYELGIRFHPTGQSYRDFVMWMEQLTVYTD
ncbi:MAG: PilZ domain-containing protein [Acidobacteria bacterium]|nr:PilZ domain-containing protein [Acidobacteriota bacterium]